MKKVISILGPPGAGKDTQCILISKKFKIKIISPGDILRKETRKNTSLGRKIKDTMKKGNLIPDEVVEKIIKSEVKKSKRNVLLSGTPRDLDQAKRLKIDFLIFLRCTKKEITGRLLKRAKTQHRSDDTRKTIEHRWKVYKEMTEPVIAYYKKKSKLKEVNGNHPIKEVFKQVYPIIKKILENDNL